MNQPDIPPADNAVPKRRRRWPVIVAVVFVGAILLGGVGFVGASMLEEHDTFCISCHTVPETTYFNRAYFSLDNPTDLVTDLATDHYHLAQINNNTTFSCINCHRGDSSLMHRISTVVLGGRDAAIYLLGKENPAIERTRIAEGWLPNAACVSCHSDTLLKLGGLDTHFHNKLPQAAEALAKGGKLTVPDALASQKDILLQRGLQTVDVPLMCTDCHAAHATIQNGKKLFFMEIDKSNENCVSCHKAAGEGPQDPNKLR